MRLRGTPTFGGGSYYKLIGAAHLGSPVQLGDARLSGPHGLRGGNLLRYAGPEFVIGKTPPKDITNESEIPPADAQQQPADRE